MEDSTKTREQLLDEVRSLRRLIATLETAAVEQRQTELRLLKEAQVSDAALKRSEATGQALLESASEGIVLVNASGRITLVNAAAERMFGYDHDELLGQPLEILLLERVRGAHAEHRVRYFAGPRVRPMGTGLDLAGRRRDGSEFPVEISLSYVESSEGMTAMALVTDITERKRVEAELQRQRDTLYQTEKLAALGTLSAGIAHEMNNPLGIITSRIEVMLLDAEEHNLPTQVLEDLQVLHRATQRVARIATNLRSFARQTPREHARVDLNAVVQETLLLMQRPLEVDGIRLTTRLDPTLAPILGDASTLQQVLLNLVTNARSDGERWRDSDRNEPGRRTDGLGAAGHRRYRSRHLARGALEGLRSLLHNQENRNRIGALGELRHHPGSSRHGRRAVRSGQRDHIRARIPGGAGRTHLSF